MALGAWQSQNFLKQSQSGKGLGKGAWRLALGAWQSQNFLRDMGLQKGCLAGRGRVRVEGVWERVLGAWRLALGRVRTSCVTWACKKGA